MNQIDKKAKENVNNELQSILDSITEPIILIDKKYEIRRANRATLELPNSKNYDSIEGKNCYEVLFQRSSVCPYCPLNKAGNSSEKLRGPNLEAMPKLGVSTEILLKFDGKNEILDLSFFPIESEDGIYSFVEKISVITKVKEKDEENLRMRNLASLGIMVSGIAHELTNPLTGIGMTLQNLQNNLEKYDLTNISERLQIISDDLQRASLIVADIISFAKQEKIKLTNSDIVETVIKARETVERLYPALCESVAWEFIREKETRFYFNPLKMERLFINLFRNSLQALDYTQGKISIEIKRKKNNCQIVVEDTGGGIEAEVIDKIFDPFFTNKKDGEGTGLGLSVCHSIVKEHGGRINVKSFDGKTRFIISIPIDRQGN
jgi:signal transduction histidine kinase